MASKLIAYNNGKFVPLKKLRIEPDNLGYARNFGVFDFLRASGKKGIFIEDHLDRFENAQKFLFDEIVYSKSTILDIIDTLLSRNNLDLSTLKLILSGEIKKKKLKPYLVIINKPYKAFKKKFYLRGTKLLLREYTRASAEVKSLDYFESFKLYNQMQYEDAIDVLYYNETTVTEASRSNIFMVKNNTIYTPESSILEGITRKQILERINFENAIIIRDFSLSELLDADEVFISSTLKKVMPIVNIGDYTINIGEVGPITKQMMNAFDNHVAAVIKS